MVANLAIPYNAVFNRVKFKQPGAKGFVYFYSCAYDFTA
jgi:hypothetical protein